VACDGEVFHGRFVAKPRSFALDLNTAALFHKINRVRAEFYFAIAGVIGEKSVRL
jgi:hypothetical protein